MGRNPLEDGPRVQLSKRDLRLSARIGAGELVVPSSDQVIAEAKKTAEAVFVESQRTERVIKNTEALTTGIRDVTAPYEGLLTGIAEELEVVRQVQWRREHPQGKWAKRFRQPIRDIDGEFVFEDAIQDEQGTAYPFQIKYRAEGVGEQRKITPLDYKQSNREGGVAYLRERLDPNGSGGIHIQLHEGMITRYQVPIYDFQYETAKHCQPSPQDQPILSNLVGDLEKKDLFTINLIFSLNTTPDGSVAPHVFLNRWGYIMDGSFNIKYAFNAEKNHFEAPAGGLHAVGLQKQYPEAYNTKAFLNLLGESLSLIPARAE